MDVQFILRNKPPYTEVSSCTQYCSICCRMIYDAWYESFCRDLVQNVQYDVTCRHMVHIGQYNSNRHLNVYVDSRHAQ